MSRRGIVFQEGSYYHVFNRGIDKKIIFYDKEDIKYFLDRLADFNNDKPVGGIQRQKTQKYKKYRGKASILVEIVAYCLLPNHFHLVLRQVGDDGVSRFIQRICTGYVMYYNKKYKRSGSLFQGKFKATMLDAIDSVYRLSVYVNLNYKHHRIDPDKKMVASSIGEYLDIGVNKNLCSKSEVASIVDNIGGQKKYKEYAKSQSRIFAENKEVIISDIAFDELEGDK
jgi:REP element-mobilizing transposase RayT